MYDTVIIGAGIAGLSAAIYASRNRMKFVILASSFGGQFMESGEVLNYPGISRTTGVNFSKTMQEQLSFNNVKVNVETVKFLKKKKNGFNVVTDKNVYETKTVIIATGARARRLGIPGEDRLQNRGVTYCAICDGPLFKNKHVAVIGGGDAAAEAVDFLKNICSKITMITIDSDLSAQPYLKERLKKNPKVTIICDAATEEFYGTGMIQGLKYHQVHKKGAKTKDLKVDGVIIEIGRVPNTEFVKDFLPLDQHGHIIIDGHCNTEIPGIFAAGDCASGHEYQYVIAAGQGCMALIKAVRYLAKQK